MDAELVGDGADAFKLGAVGEPVLGAGFPGAPGAPAMLVPVVDGTFCVSRTLRAPIRW